MLTGQVDYPFQVFIKQVTLFNQVFCCLFYQAQILILGIVSLFD